MNSSSSPIRRPPFQGLTGRHWANLLILALAVFWLAQVALDVAWGNVFGRFASDAGSFWSAGYIANHYGYASVYDLELMARAQQSLLAATPDGPGSFDPIPTPYLPVFLLPFQLIALVPPVTAAAAWILVNAAGTVLYLHAYSRRATGLPIGFRTLALMMVSAPVFINIFTGQVNLLLMIGVGEFLLCASRGKSLQAGLWLGLLLIKPQYLVLLVPALLLQREFRALFGLLLSSALVVGSSILLAGIDAILGPVRLWLGYAQGPGLPSNDVALMINWRMLAVLLEGLVPASVAWIIAVGGLCATVILAVSLWRRPQRPGSITYLVFMAGLLAATCAVAWHSHIHGAMILIPVLLVLHKKHAQVLGDLLEWWVLLPAALYLLRLVLAALLHGGVLSATVGLYVDGLAGIGLFVMNLVLLGWAVRFSRLPRVPAQ